MDDADEPQLARRLNKVLFKKDHLDLDDTACALDKVVHERFICIWGG
jgi:hypothetical protein